MKKSNRMQLKWWLRPLSIFAQMIMLSNLSFSFHHVSEFNILMGEQEMFRMDKTFLSTLFLLVPVFELVWSCAEILSMIGRRASFSDRKTILQKNSQRAKSSDNTRRGRNHFTFICLATPHPRRHLSWFLGATSFRMYSLFQINSKIFHNYLRQFPIKLKRTSFYSWTYAWRLDLIFGTTDLAGWMPVCLWLWKWGGGLGSF